MTLSPASKFSATIGAFAVAAAALLGLGWRAANSLRDITDEMKALRTELKSMQSGFDADVSAMRGELRSSSIDRWSIYDMERWTRQLERRNGEKISVPEPREFRQ